MNISKLLAAFLLAAFMSNAVIAADLDYADADAEQRSERAERESDLYEDGTDAIDEGEWEEAIDKFTRVAEMKGNRADGALYWTAYALHKLNRRAEAIKTIDVLKKKHPSSRWINDAKALELEVRQKAGERVKPENVDDDVKVIAIQTLMHTDPEKAYPLLEKIVRGGSYSKKMKEQALFILAQSPSPRAQTLIADIARGSANPEIQEEAIRYLGIHGGQRNGQLLAEIYSAPNMSVEARGEVLKAWMISGNKARVFEAAKSEKNLELREDAIKLLGVMGGRAELAQLYATETSREMKEEIITGLFIAGDHARITDLATNEKDSELRAEAIQKLGLMGSKSTPALLNFYATGDRNVKEAVVDGLFVMGNAKALIGLAKKETNREMKKEILQKLSVMGSDDAVTYMLEILEEN
jgi:tetratricopeptide (TPR) repeat protein